MRGKSKVTCERREILPLAESGIVMIGLSEVRSGAGGEEMSLRRSCDMALPYPEVSEYK